MFKFIMQLLSKGPARAALLLGSLLVVQGASAALLGVAPGFPRLSFVGENAGVVYNAGSQNLNVDAAGAFYGFALFGDPNCNLIGTPRCSVVPASVGGNSVQIRVVVDNAGQLVGGQAGPDLQVTGAINFDGNPGNDVDGVLLIGEVVQMGSGGNLVDFRFTVTGGLLAGDYVGKQIGLTLTAEGASGSFASSFTALPKGNIGPETPNPDIALCKQVSLTGGDPFFDADNNVKNRCDDFMQSIPSGPLGSAATYRLLVINTGTEPLVNLIINDANLGLVNIPVSGGALLPGQERVIDSGMFGFGDLHAPGRCATPGVKPNMAVVDATGQSSMMNVSDADPAAVRCVEESIKILKEVSVDGGATFFDANDSASAPTTLVGGNALYRITVTNDGSSDLENVVVNDATLGIVDFPVGNLAAGAFRVLTQGDIGVLDQPGRCQVPGDLTNIADVAGDSVDSGNTVTDSDPAVVKCVKESIDLLKEVSVDGGMTWFDANDSNSAPATAVGGGALYRFTVTNTGSSALTNVVVNDATLGIVDFPVGDLAPSQVVILTDGEISALNKPGRCATPGDVTNVANVLGESVDSGNEVTDSDPAVVRCVEEKIELLKEVSIDGGVTWHDANDGASAPVAMLGGGALYRITVTNTGTSDLNNVVVEDENLMINHVVGFLAAGDFRVLDSGVIPALEQPGRCQTPGDVTNIATVKGTSADTNAMVSDSDPAVVRCVEEEIKLVKEVSVDNGATWHDANDSASAPATTVGGGALYRFTITNTGSSDLVNLKVNDATLGIVDFPVPSLAAGATLVLTSGQIPALAQAGRCATPGDVTNIASVVGTSVDSGNDVSDSDPAVVRCVEEDIDLLKEVSVDGGATWHDANDAASTPATVVGGGATYRITVTNTGTTILENVVVNDATLGIVNYSVGTLGVSQTVVLTSGDIPALEQPGRCATPGTVNNIATTSGMSAPTGNTVSDSDPANVRCVEERIKLLKEVSVDGGATFHDANDAASAPATSVGGGALYRLTVTNTGTSDLINVVINDATLGVVDHPVGNLAAGAFVVLEQGQIPALNQPGRCQNPGNVTNIATVNGESVDTGNTVSDSDPAVVKCEQTAVCAIQVEKTCIVEPPPPSDNLLCESAISATTLRYVGPDISGATVVFTGDKKGSATYTNVNLVSGMTVLTSPSQNGFTIDAGAGEGLGSKTFITINGVQEIIHTSCSAIYSAGAPAPLDGNTPNPPNSDKGDPSPNWFVENFRDKDDAFVEVPDTTPPTGAESCVVQPREASCDTLGKPSSLTFRYTGGGCPGNNSQGSKSDCSGSVNGGLSASITVPSGYSVSPTSVAPGELFTVTRGGSDFSSSTVIRLSNAGGTQVNDVHTSCSAPLEVGDEFGGMTLVSFNGDSGGTAVTYRYLVSNTGNTDVDLTTVFDDKLGELLSPAPQALAQGATLELLATTSITQETTNVVDVMGNVAGVPGAQCEATDAVTVSVPPPPPEPVTCSDIKDITGLRLVWNGANGVDVESELGQVFTGVNKGDTLLLDASKDQTGNDVDLFLSGAVNGQSRFHISCSDSEMNGTEDCGKAQGNGKDDSGSFVNSFLLDGMTGENGSFNCHIPQATGSELSGSYPGPGGGGGAGVMGASSLDLGDKKKVKWELTNNSNSDVFVTRVTITWPSQHGEVKKFKLEGDFAKDVFDATSPTVVPDEKAFESDANKRKLKKNDSKNLEVEFTADYQNHTEGQFTITVEFDNGQVVSFP